MKVTEPQAFSGHAVKMRRGVSDAAIRGDVAIPQVVGQYYDEVGPGMLRD